MTNDVVVLRPETENPHKKIVVAYVDSDSQTLLQMIEEMEWEHKTKDDITLLHNARANNYELRKLLDSSVCLLLDRLSANELRKIIMTIPSHSDFPDFYRELNKKIECV